MNILYTSYSEYRKQLGGAEICTYLNAKEQSKHNRIIYANSNLSGLRDNILYVRFPGLSKIPLIYTVVTAVYFIYFILKYKIDEVHAFDRLTTVPAIIAGKLTHKKILVTIQDYWFRCNLSTMYHNGYLCNGSLISELRSYNILRWPWEISKYISAAIARILLRTVKVIAISEFVKKILKESGIDSNVIYNPIDLSYSENAKKIKGYNKKIILYAGRLSYEKGVHVLINAFKQLNDNRSVLLIIGEGQERSSLERLSKGNKNIVFLKRLDSTQKVYNYYKTADVIVYPVLWDEPYGRVIAEAKTMNKKIVATRSGGIVEQLKDYKNGLLVPKNDSGALSKAIKTILKQI